MGQVSAATFEANFYVERGDIGKPLAACIVRSLSEMNTDPTGAALQASPVEFVREVMRDKSRLLGFTIVLLSCPLSDAESSAFGAVCRELDIPVIIARSAGLLGYVRVAFSEMQSLEPKNDDQDKMREDFWLTEFDHFPELQQLGTRVISTMFFPRATAGSDYHPAHPHLTLIHLPQPTASTRTTRRRSLMCRLLSSCAKPTNTCTTPAHSHHAAQNSRCRRMTPLLTRHSFRV